MMLKKKLKSSNQKSYYQKQYPSKNIKRESHKVSSIFLQKVVNDAITSGKFPDNLKLTDVTPLEKPFG